MRRRLHDLSLEVQCEAQVVGGGDPVPVGVGRVERQRQQAALSQRVGVIRDLNRSTACIDLNGHVARARHGGQVTGQLVGHAAAVGELPGAVLREGQLDAVAGVGQHHILTLFVGGGRDGGIGQVVGQVGAGSRFLFIRHAHGDHGAIDQGDGQGLLAGEGLLTAQQEVLLPHVHVLFFVIGDQPADLLNGHQVFVGEFHRGHVLHVQRGLAIYNM